MAAVTSAALVVVPSATAAPLQEWIDPSFAVSGARIFPGEGDGFAKTAIDADGRVLIATSTGGDPPQVRLRRLTADGAVDGTFAGGELSLPATPQLIHSDLAGTTTVVDLPPAGGGVRVSRLTATGNADVGFGSGGTQTVLSGQNIDFVFAITERAGGGMLLAAYQQSLSSRSFVVAITGSGSLDTSWAAATATPGILELNGQGVSDVDADSDHIVMLNLTDLSIPNRSIQRYTADGALDTTFASGGQYTFPDGFGAQTITVTADAYLIGGSSAEPFTPGSSMAVYRMLRSGLIDSGFGTGGRAIGPDEECSLAGDRVHVTSSFIYVMGQRGDCGASPVFINRFTHAGLIDSAYGEGNELVVDAVAGRDVLSGHGIAVLDDDRALVYVDAVPPGTESDDAGVVRLKANVSGDPVFPFTGFFQPVRNPPALNSMKAGAAVPVKFALGGNQGLNIFQPGYPASQQVHCDTEAPINGIEETLTAGNSGLNYDPVAGQYTFLWKTSKAWKDSCRQLILRLADGTSHTANFLLT